MELYKRKFEEDKARFRKLQKIYMDYIKGKIDEDEAYELYLKAGKKNINYSLNEKIKIQEMSYFKDIVSYINSFNTLEDAHKGTNFSKLAEALLDMYLGHIKMTGSKETIEEYIMNSYKKNNTPKTEVKKAKDIKLFWDFVKDIIKYIEKDKD